MGLGTYAMDLWAELREAEWPSLASSARRMACIVVVFLVLGGFALLTRYVTVEVRELVVSVL
jgi:hypothetical protein